MSVNTDMAVGKTPVEAFAIREVYEGKIANTVSALTDSLYVICPQMEDDDDPKNVHRRFVIGWDRRQDGSYPQSGNKCLIARGDLGNLWLLRWWPYS